MTDFISQYAIPLIVAALVIGYGLGVVSIGIILSIRERSEE
jgi:hypothetical protein